MFEFIFEIIGDIFEWICDLFTSNPEGIIEVITTTAIATGVIYAASLTVDRIRAELKTNKALVEKGATSAIIQEFIKESGYVRVSFSALNAANKQVGTFSINTNDTSNLREGQKITI